MDSASRCRSDYRVALGPLDRNQFVYHGVNRLRQIVSQLMRYSAVVGINFNSASHSSDCFCHASHIGPL